ncbi:MAG TPA: sulfite exporter TauE/SafE family protein [Pedobacter sp.]|uniref:sulfite exporter TauE/SafE family protein n=1 Tax=Pedobacter sp. TaxID=1411316 RepID=UPI002C1B9209|nr:sulfite exporter TauE/SafE family protein [Pedobacter sp.]HMI02250.1 sulfite exporter TauE/SafE family protein [Pedobacter sp.]
MSDDRLAFFIGLLGSLHCIGMCGPLAFAVPVNQPGWVYLLWNKFIYQFGRIVSYCSLGVLAGLLGRQLWLSGIQQGISIATGLMILLAASSRLFRWYSRFKNPSLFIKPFNRLFDFAFRHKANHLFIGMINGLLPCGFVYLALAGAINTGSVQNSVFYMFWFGAGTTPLMFAATLIVGFSGLAFRKRLNKSIPYLMLVLGTWFILRGLELNIPYLSPQRPGSQTEVCK